MFSIATMLGGCSLSASGARPRVALSTDCERLAVEVPAPHIREGGDVYQSVAEHRVALGSANSNLRATRACQVRQRERLAR